MRGHRQFSEQWNQLLSDVSTNQVGIKNCTTRRDWRPTIDGGVTVASGYDWFWPSFTGDDPGYQPFPLKAFRDNGPITMVHDCQRADGRSAVVVGTPTALYRFLYDQDSCYVEDCYVEDCYVGESDSPEWIQIGSGYTEGSRWQAEDIGGVTVFNNGADLPCWYSINEVEVHPVYELRDIGVARCGCMALYSNIIVFGDITEIKSEKFNEMMLLYGSQDSGNVLLTTSSGTCTTPVDFFVANADFPSVHADDYWIGRFLVLDDGTEFEITGWTDERTVTVTPADDYTNQHFTVRVKFEQAGAALSSPVTVSVTPGSTTATASAPYFNIADEGSTLMLANGWNATIVTFSDNQHVELSIDPDEAYSYSFWIADPVASYQITASAPVFLAEHAGLTAVFSNGTVRNIVSVSDNMTVVTDFWATVDESNAGITKPEAYGYVSDVNDTNRYQYRVMWGLQDSGTKFGAIGYCSMTAGLPYAILDRPYKSFVSGQTVVIGGAGINGSNLTAKILLAAGDISLVLDTAASTTVTAGLIQSADTVGSIVGFEDPLGDYSGIVNMAPLSGVLVIYKDKSIVFGTFTGSTDAPFTFRWRQIPESQALYYRNTLVNIGDNYHLYAGRSEFYYFDIYRQTPDHHEGLLQCAKTGFFDRASIANTNYIFAADNTLTQEAFFCCQSEDGEDGALCWDYHLNKARTTSAMITAAATIKRPGATATFGAVDKWFAMGLDDDTFVVYGLANENVESWGDVKEIFYRRSGEDSDKYGYDAIIQSGISSFGTDYGEKHIGGYQLCGQSGAPDTALTFELLGADSAQGGFDVDCTETLDSPEAWDLIPLHYLRRYFGDRITRPSTSLAGATISSRTFSVMHVGSDSWTQRKA